MDVVCEVERAVLLRRLGHVAARRDVWPFAVMHVAVLATCAHFVVADHITWHLLLLAAAASAALHVVAFLSSTWSVKAKAFFQFRKVNTLDQATHVLAHPTDATLKAEICDIVKGEGPARIVFQRLPYTVLVDAATGAVTCDILQYPVNEQLTTYSESTGLSSAKVQELTAQFGTNDITIDPASFWDLYIQQITAPIFVFQVFCMILYMLDDYWYFSLVTLAMLLFIERITTQQRLKNLNELQGMRPKPYELRVFRDRKWEWRSTASLVPGDLIALPRTKHAMHKVPADVVVLAGTCVVNEALLTGEAVPLRKEGVDKLLADRGSSRLSAIPDAKRYYVFAGTTVLQTTGAPKERAVKPRDTSCLCVVVRTGFATQEGTLVRTFLASREQASANTWESLAIISFLLVFALAAAGYVFNHGLATKRPLHTLIIECLLIITSVIPPELPLQLSLAITNALKAMNAKSIAITCTEPFRIPMAGRASVVCLDKTGTLTEDKVNLQGLVVPCDSNISTGGDGSHRDGDDDDDEDDDDNDDYGDEGAGGGALDFKLLHPVDIRMSSDRRAEIFLAACTDVVEVEKELVGDPLELAVLTSLGWSCVRDTVARPSANLSARKIHTFPFSSELKRMSVVCTTASAGVKGVFLVCKGAAEVIRPRLTTVPSGFDEMHKHYAREGKRVLALAYKSLPADMKHKVQRLSREEAEKDLTFVGFIVLGSPLKSDTRKVMRQLLRSSHHLVMITGDSPLTACYVARRVRIASRPLRVIDHDATSRHFVHYLADDDANAGTLDALTPEQLSTLFQNNDLCVTGAVVEAAAAEHSLPDVARYAKVFARTSPKDKSRIVRAYQHLGLSAVMCGDGTNDVGALKVADAGIALVSGGRPPRKAKKKSKKAQEALSMREKALLDFQRELETMNLEDSLPKLGDASIAAAFTSKISSCSCVTHLIRQGRATLVVSNQMIQILALNCLINSFCLSVLYLEGIKLSDTQMTLSGLAIAMSMYFVSASRPQKKLSPQRPRASSVTAYMFGSVLLQFAFHVYMLLSAIRTAQAVEGRIHFDPAFLPPPRRTLL
ncbi:hypothetical protein PTSG_07409 [Salpingoeca rosetta]|uniref:Uncharacterized protein n=1 Tax=Salpingoeca rosetta (strain ATCC 50818 / BSB-021) TaxID=946362 RepID=F2UIM0_SALR5|nr:uncharacterized protein PTSG_07409 [Salpingoeca rosetta]EGD77069.1 hypothetical protein PTSG_07409 [Salpingoeca rosetta]|eukprot:XP_004990909.1 hypothetical protein PTSG_07409 [Salpingoeca rosetta]